MFLAVKKTQELNKLENTRSEADTLWLKRSHERKVGGPCRTGKMGGGAVTAFLDNRENKGIDNIEQTSLRGETEIPLLDFTGSCCCQLPSKRISAL